MHDDDSITEDNSDQLIDPREDVALKPNEVADPDAIVRRVIPADVFEKYEVYSYRNAAVILSQTRRAEFSELLDVLRKFSLTTEMIRKPGGNESEIPKLLSARLRPLGWHETIIQGDLDIKLRWRVSTCRLKNGKPVFETRERLTRREKFLDGHKIDYVKNRVAFDLEWNSKDQTFDRDLYAFSAFAQCGVVDAAVLVTRSAELNPVFRALGPALNKVGEESQNMTSSKYGASTTWMGKLLYRLNAGRNGGCPVLAMGIRPTCISDWPSGSKKPGKVAK